MKGSMPVLGKFKSNNSCCSSSLSDYPSKPKHRAYLQPCLKEGQRFKIQALGLLEPSLPQVGFLLGGGDGYREWTPTRKVKVQKADGAVFRL